MPSGNERTSPRPTDGRRGGGVSRRDFLRAFGVGAAGLGLARAALAGQAPEPKKTPNIIFILADDLGYGDLGCFGQKLIHTPCLDRMAAEGMRFTDFYAGSTVCAPSRSCLMTGQHTGHTIVRGNALVPLRPQDITVAEVLKKSGYTTGLVGKWGLGEPGTTGWPTKKGFDSFYGLVNQVNCHFYYPPYVWRDEKKVVLEGNDPKKQTGQYVHDLFSTEALAFVDRSKDKPFFLYLAYTIPHAELAVPQDSLEPYLGKFPETPYMPKSYHYGQQKTPKAAFAGMVSRLDRDVGRLLDRLKALGIDKDTVVFFTSDNGPHKEGGADPAFFHSSGPLTGTKRSLTEGGIRVPLIVRWPGTVKAGSTSHHPSAFWDFLPTAGELAGAQLPRIEHLDGISMVPSLLGRDQRRHEFLYWEFHEGRASCQAVRMGDWKAIVNPYGSPPRLYDLREDIAEKTDLADKHPEIVAKIEAYLKTARTDSQKWPLRLPKGPATRKAAPATAKPAAESPAPPQRL